MQHPEQNHKGAAMHRKTQIISATSRRAATRPMSQSSEIINRKTPVTVATSAEQAAAQSEQARTAAMWAERQKRAQAEIRRQMDLKDQMHEQQQRAREAEAMQRQAEADARIRAAKSTRAESGAMQMPAAMPMQMSAKMPQAKSPASSSAAMEAGLHSKHTAKELKAQAIEKALMRAADTPATKKKPKSMHLGWGKVMLALSSAAVAVCAIVYLVNINTPNISMKVAAMQTGIDAIYPSYIPRGYSISDITSEKGKVTMNFANSEDGKSYRLTEEKSSWDSHALLENFVKATYDDNYTVVKENGLTIYISGSNATWVNSGIIFKITATPGTLTKKQIKTIAISL